MKTPISLFGIALTGLFSCQTSYLPSYEVKSSEQDIAQTQFVEANDAISFEDRSRRKWDAAVIADLDQDGYQDLLITEHSNQVKLFWNNQGIFAAPVRVLGGDSHGIAAGDFNQDGVMDLIVSMGGGGGKKPSYPKVFTVSPDRKISRGQEFPLYQRSRGRAVKLLDADNDGDLDTVFSAFPLKSQPKGANYLYLNQDAKLTFSDILPQAKWLGYKVAVTDFNNDNDADIIFYGGENMVAVQGGQGASFTNNSGEVLAELADINDVSSIAEIDYDNDGDFDLFLTRAKHQFKEQTYYDPTEKRIAFFARNQKFKFDDLTIDGNFKLENLQMAFPHFDVFVGAKKQLQTFAVDRHGSKNLELTPEQAKGWPKKLAQKGLYIGYLGEGVWRIAGETSSPTAAVVHNVISVPKVSENELLPVKLLENRDGKFVDVTAQLGIDIQEQTTSATVGDFDNDGWSDIFVMRYGSMAQANEQILLTNRQGKGFSSTANHGLISKELGATGGGAESFDFDKDGNLDIVFSNERGRWHLFENQAEVNGNQFVSVEVGNSPKNLAPALGAKLVLQACGNQYVRAVGATSSAFSQSANNHLHVGLGACKEIEQAVVRWSNGEQSPVTMPTTNTIYSAGTF